jgi:hypothetical protein
LQKYLFFSVAGRKFSSDKYVNVIFLFLLNALFANESCSLSLSLSLSPRSTQQQQSELGGKPEEDEETKKKKSQKPPPSPSAADAAAVTKSTPFTTLRLETAAGHLGMTMEELGNFCGNGKVCRSENGTVT